MVRAVIWIVMIATFLYGLGLALRCWKNESKTGALAILLLTISVMVAPFFSVLKQ